MRPLSPSPRRTRSRTRATELTAQPTRRYSRSLSKRRALPSEPQRSYAKSRSLFTLRATAGWFALGLLGLFLSYLGTVLYLDLNEGVHGDILGRICSYDRTWLGPVLGLGDTCAPEAILRGVDRLGRPLGTHRRGQSTDTEDGYDWARVKANLFFATNFFNNLPHYQLQSLEEAGAPKDLPVQRGLWATWHDTNNELRNLIDNHILQMVSVEEQVARFITANEPHYQDLVDCGSDNCTFSLYTVSVALDHVVDGVLKFPITETQAKLRGLEQQARDFKGAVDEMRKTSRQLKRGWTFWERRCTEEEIRRFWDLSGKRRFKKKDSADPLCKLDLEHLRPLFEHDLPESFDSLITFSDALLLFYQKFNDRRIVRSLQQEKRVVDRYDYQGSVESFQRIHENIMEARNILLSGVNLLEGSRRSHDLAPSLDRVVFARLALSKLSFEVKQLPTELEGLELQGSAAKVDGFYNSLRDFSSACQSRQLDLRSLFEVQGASVFSIKEQLMLMMDQFERHYKVLKDYDSRICSTSSWRPGLRSSIRQVTDDLVIIVRAITNCRAQINGLRQQTQSFRDNVTETQTIYRDIQRELVTWTEQCSQYWRRGTFGFFKAKEITDPYCRADLANLRDLLEQDIPRAHDALRTFADASLMSYERLNREFSSITKSLEDERRAAETQSWNCRAYSIHCESIHKRVVKTTQSLVELGLAVEMAI